MYLPLKRREVFPSGGLEVCLSPLRGPWVCPLEGEVLVSEAWGSAD